MTRSAPRTPSARAGVNRWWLCGAGGLAVAAVIFVVLIGPALTSGDTIYVTAPGERRTVELSDGSTIVLNGGSTLMVRMSGQERRVEMASAEAAFDIAYDAHRPFRVIVGYNSIEVLGTAFEVRRDAVSTRVSVTRGLVRVSDVEDPSRTVRLTMRQSLTRSDATGELKVTSGSTEPGGWRASQLVYDDRPLSEVVADLNRAYQNPIRATGGAGEMRFTGVLALDGQDETLRRLQSILPVAAARRGDVVELRPR